MKTSELINQLNNEINNHGDYDIEIILPLKQIIQEVIFVATFNNRTIILTKEI